MSKVEAKKAGRTLADFRAAHDKNVIIPAKIKKALDEMAKQGPQHHEYEADLVRIAGISQSDLAKFREQFAEHIVVVNHQNGKALSSPKNVWFHDVKVARQLREE